METKKKDLEPARDRTDHGLDEERAKTDIALARAGVADETVADADLAARRAHADESLETGREESDALLRASQKASPLHSRLVHAERALADDGRERERAMADSILQHERDRVDEAVRVAREDRRDVDERLGRDRAETDDRLRQERKTTDEVVDDASLLLAREQAAHARAKTDVARRDDLMALVSHELRNPLTVIAFNARVLLDSPPSGAALKTLAQDVQMACDQMTHLVGDLLDVASIEIGRLNVTLAHGDAVKLLRDAIAANAAMLKGRWLSLAVEEPERPLFAHFDHTRLIQVFANLFGNAAKFTQRGGTVSVSVAKVQTMVQFCVADTGRGIAAADLPHVFERFWQLGKGDRRGLGLGLHICKGIVEAHGGSMWVASEVGVGSRFYFSIPEAPAA